MSTIYDLTKEAVEQHRSQFPAESVTVWQGKKVRVSLYRYQGLLYLSATNGVLGQSATVRAGICSPLNGWAFSLTRADYNSWVSRVKKL